jgi:hypothetical protein
LAGIAPKDRIPYLRRAIADAGGLRRSGFRKHEGATEKQKRVQNDDGEASRMDTGLCAKEEPQGQPP